MTAGSSLTLELHGVRLRLESDIEPFAAYVRAAMEPYLCEGDGEADITSRLQWVDGFASRDLARAFPGRGWQRRPDRDLYLDADSAAWLRIDDFPDLQLAMDWTGQRLELTGRYHFHVGSGAGLERLRRLRHRGGLDRLRGRRFSTLLYYLVYHPILWQLGRREGWSVLHAGAVAAPQGAIVLAGMPGCGKSTLAVAMLAEERRRMMSDNLVLHDGDRVRSCPELLLLDERSRARAGQGASRLVATGERRVYERDALRIDRGEDRPQAPLAIVNVGRARATALESLGAAECAARIVAGNTMAKEVRRIAIMGEVLDLVAGTERPDEQAMLGRLAERAPCYQLWIEQDAPLDAVISEHLEPLLAARAGRRVGT